MADGSGGPLRLADVRIQGDRILAMGQLKAATGDKIVDARGLVLAPGFIDIHNHSSEGLTKDPAAESQVSQGITTVILGPDGGSPWPIGEYLEQRRQHPAAVNLQVMVGHATVRTQVMGKDYRRAATADEIAKMSQLVEQAMQEGAVGLSTGLEYEVGSYSTTEEVIALAQAAAKHGGIYMSHMRDEGDEAFQSIAEAVRIGEEAHIPVQISHIKLGTAKVWGKSAEAAKLIDKARARGVRIMADCYPYEAWGSTITVLLLDKKYDDPVSVKKGLDDVGGGANVTITRCAKHPEYEMKNLAEIAKSQNTDTVGLYMQIVKDGGASVVCHAMKEDDIRTFYQAPWVMVGSDGGIGMRHPRGAGTFPRVLGEYVRERQWLPLQTAVQKMTSLPAAQLKLKDRGTVAKGNFADLVLFDPAKVIDGSTFADPQKLSTGIERVWVNGAIVWESGKPTGTFPGRVVK